MSKHIRLPISNQQLQVDKKWADLSFKQQQKIIGWMRLAFFAYYPDDDAILSEVFRKIDKCRIWIPDKEVIWKYRKYKRKLKSQMDAIKNTQESSPMDVSVTLGIITVNGVQSNRSLLKTRLPYNERND